MVYVACGISRPFHPALVLRSISPHRVFAIDIKCIPTAQAAGCLATYVYRNLDKYSIQERSLRTRLGSVVFLSALWDSYRMKT